MERLYDVFDNYDITYEELSEANGGISDLGEIPTGVLGAFRVKHAFGAGIPFGISRNGRVYTKKVWENAFKENNFQEAYKHRMVVGMISHPKDDLTYDDMLREELASHVLVDVNYKEVQKDTGIYEALFYILDTKAGRTLKAILQAGGKPAVSTRAYGALKNESVEYEGKKLPLIDENNFSLVTLDVVAIPGIKNARFSEIKLSEELKEDIKYLKEKMREHQCENGLCDLFEEYIKEDIKEDTDKVIKNEDKLEELKEFSKEELIEFIKTLSKENKQLREKQVKDNEKGFSKSFIKAYIYFVEILSKLLKYNLNYEKEFNELIEILDKDNKIEKSDFNKIEKILKKIENDELIDQSIKTIAIKFKSFLVKSKNIKEMNEDVLNDLLEGIGAIYYYFFNKDKEYSDKLNDLQKLYTDAEERIKTYKEISKKLGLQYASVKEHLLKNETTIKKLNNNINKIQNKYDKLLSEVKDTKKLENVISDIKQEKESILNKYNELKEEHELFLQEYNDKLNDLNKQINELKEINKKQENESIKLLKEINKISDENNEIKKQYKFEILKIQKELKEYQTKYLIYKYQITEQQANKLLEDGISIAEEKAKKLVKKLETSSFDIKEKVNDNSILNRLNRII